MSSLPGSSVKNSDKKTCTVAVVGNPNTGKTTLFNALCGTRQKVGNYPGVTIERKTGQIFFDDYEARLIDLPGTYSLQAVSYDEQVVVDSLMGRVKEIPRPDAIIFIIDATNIKRNLFLYTQILELAIPVLVVLTMADLLEGHGVTLDLKILTKELGSRVIPTTGGTRKDIELIKKELTMLLHKKSLPRTMGAKFPEGIEKITGNLHTELKRHHPISHFETRNLIFFKMDPLNHLFSDNPEAQQAIAFAREAISNKHFHSQSMIIAKRYHWAEAVVNKAEIRDPDLKDTITTRTDRILTHKIYGLVSFLALMYAVFASIYSWATPMMDGIDALINYISDAINANLAATPMLASLLSDGIVGGVGSVIVFLPQIAILFLFIAILEDSGYLARAAFLMDKLLGWTGLNGRAFIPMLSSFACAVPGVMAARVMTDPRARLTTVLIAPLMSCSARLPIYILLIGAFIEPVYGAAIAGLMLFLMHGVGLFVALPVAWILNHGILKTPPTSFLLELPPYRAPKVRDVLYRVWEAMKKFIIRAGTVIFALTLVIWALTFFPRPTSLETNLRDSYNKQIEKMDPAERELQIIADGPQLERKIAAAYMEQSYLGRTGKFIQPIFAPLGFDWKITIGILGAFPAREVIIATLGIIYSVGDPDAESVSLRQRMRNEKRADGTPVFSPLTAISLMIFFALCCQCMSTVITVQRELRSWRWATFLFFYMTILSYIASFLIYQTGSALGF